MKKFQVTLMVPQVRTIEAADIQEAHNYVSKMMAADSDKDKNPTSKVHSIYEIEEAEIIEFGPLPEAE